MEESGATMRPSVVDADRNFTCWHASVHRNPAAIFSAFHPGGLSHQFSYCRANPYAGEADKYAERDVENRNRPSSDLKSSERLILKR